MLPYVYEDELWKDFERKIKNDEKPMNKCELFCHFLAVQEQIYKLVHVWEFDRRRIICLSF